MSSALMEGLWRPKWRCRIVGWVGGRGAGRVGGGGVGAVAVRPLSGVAEVAVENFWCQNGGKIN